MDDKKINSRGICYLLCLINGGDVLITVCRYPTQQDQTRQYWDMNCDMPSSNPPQLFPPYEIAFLKPLYCGSEENTKKRWKTWRMLRWVGRKDGFPYWWLYYKYWLASRSWISSECMCKFNERKYNCIASSTCIHCLGNLNNFSQKKHQRRLHSCSATEEINSASFLIRPVCIPWMPDSHLKKAATYNQNTTS